MGPSAATDACHTALLGSARAVVDISGTVTTTFQTDVFGAPTLTQGPSTHPFQYTGEQRDGGSGFYYLRARTYDPAIGRFLSRDSGLGAPDWPDTLDRFVNVV